MPHNFIPRKHGARRQISPSKSLHVSKKDVQSRYMTEQAEELAGSLKQVVALTAEAAPDRKMEFKLSGDARPKLSHPKNGWKECHWEEAAWRHRVHFKGPGLAWQEVISFQEMLRGTNKDTGWGEVDLLARSHHDLPVVIEVKSERTELLLAAVMQAAAYGIALRKTWEPVLKKQWQRFWKSSAGDSEWWPVVVAAPMDYWRICIGKKGKRTRCKAPESFWPALSSLVAGFREAGLVLSFAAIIHDGKDANGLPNITGVRNVNIFQPFDGNSWLWPADNSETQ
ncbi:MAG: hypothetical protein NTV08_17095 [Verrucomicrobia bacterium]|nr:hypothetical protein [Verrucomicrobiota bacterium]